MLPGAPHILLCPKAALTCPPCPSCSLGGSQSPSRSLPRPRACTTQVHECPGMWNLEVGWSGAGGPALPQGSRPASFLVLDLPQTCLTSWAGSRGPGISRLCSCCGQRHHEAPSLCTQGRGGGLGAVPPWARDACSLGGSGSAPSAGRGLHLPRKRCGMFAGGGGGRQ